MAKYITSCDETAKEMREETTFKVAGFPFPKSSVFKEECVKKALSYHPQPKDIILASYPKCDSKFLEVIVWKLLHPNSEPPPLNKVTNRYLPCMEMEGFEDSLSQKSPRLFKTYLPIHLIPFYKRSKYIYVIRSPWEACASFYQLLCEGDSNNKEAFDRFFVDFLAGDLGYGSFFKHVAQWDKMAGESNVLILCHENIRHNPRSALYSVSAFMGDGYLRQLLHHDGLAQDIMNATKWEKRIIRTPGENSGKLLPMIISEPLESVGELLWRRRFSKPTCSAKQLEQLSEMISEEMKNTRVEHVWSGLLEKYALFSL